MFRKFLCAVAGLALMAGSAVAANILGNNDVAIKFDGPSGQGQMIIYAPKYGSTNMIFATNGDVTVVGTLTAGTVITNGSTVSIQNLIVATNITAGGVVTVTGASTNLNTVRVVGLATLNNLTVSTNGTVGGTLGVTGLSTLNNVTVNTNATVGGTLGVTGVTTLNNANVRTNVVIGGTLTVTGLTSFVAAPSLNAGYTADGALTNGPTAVLPTGTSNTNGVWIPIAVNGTNLVIRAFPQ